MAAKWLSEEKLERIARLHKAGYNYEEIAVRVGHRRDVVRKIILRGCRRQARETPPAPGDFGLYAPKETIKQLCERYKRGTATINRWIAEKGIKRPDMHRYNTKRPMPPEFPELARKMTVREQERHWKANRPTLLRWRLEANIPCPRHRLHTHRNKPRQFWVDNYQPWSAA